MAYIYDLTDTWNAGATTFNAIRMNVTDTASSVSSKLVTLQVSGTEHFSVTKAGVGYFSGNVGIGVTPSAWFTGSGLKALQVGDAAFVNQTNGYSWLQRNAFTNGSNVQTYIANGFATRYQQGDGEHIWQSAASGTAGATISFTERMRINSSGLVGIGTATPATKLDINGITTIRGAADNCYLDFAGSGTASPPANLTYGFFPQAGVGLGLSSDIAIGMWTNNAERARIDSSGNVLVGTTALPSGSGTSGVGIRNVSGVIGQIIIGKTQSGTVDAQTFYYSGTYVGGIQISDTTTSLITSSDVRLKDNITDADDAANLIDAIQVRKFDWKADGSHQRYGFVAQELVTVAPEAVSQPENPDDMMGVDYSKLVPMLVKEIQSMRLRLAQLEGTA